MKNTMETSSTNSVITLILAAGEGKRMHSDVPKVLHKLCGETMIEHVLRSAENIGNSRTIVVVGHSGDEVKKTLGERVEYALQKEQLGTGHAVMSARHLLQEQEDCFVLILAGDIPLLQQETLNGLIEKTKQDGNSVTVLTAIEQDPKGYGRIIRDADGSVLGIVEDRDASDEQRQIKEINTSVWCFKLSALLFALDLLRPNNAQKEYYLTDCLEILLKNGYKVGAQLCDSQEALGVNDRYQLSIAEKILRMRINKQHMLAGVQIVDPENCYIDARAKIEPDVVIYPGNVIEGECVISKGTTLFPGNFIENCVIGKHNKVGPNAHVRPKTVTGDNCRIGNFVELKNVKLADGAKVSHLAYCGDGEIGKKSNISCGVIFSNYDGKDKFYTKVGDNVFVGCNANLVAPVTLGEGAYIAAGSTITEDVEPGDMAIARSRQTAKTGWAKRRVQRQND